MSSKPGYIVYSKLPRRIVKVFIFILIISIVIVIGYYPWKWTYEGFIMKPYVCENIRAEAIRTDICK